MFLIGMIALAIFSSPPNIWEHVPYWLLYILDIPLHIFNNAYLKYEKNSNKKFINGYILRGLLTLIYFFLYDKNV